MIKDIHAILFQVSRNGCGCSGCICAKDMKRSINHTDPSSRSPSPKGGHPQGGHLQPCCSCNICKCIGCKACDGTCKSNGVDFP